MTTRRFLWRPFAALALALALIVPLVPVVDVAGRQDAASTPADHEVHHPATPAVDDPCVVRDAAVPSDTDGMGAMSVATPGMEIMGDFDLMFIDMMTRHHEAAVAMAEVALTRAEHAEIRQLAEAIIAAQTAEIDQLRTWRDQWYPDAPAMPMDQMMAAMGQVMAEMPGMMNMPGMDMMEMMGMAMDPTAEVAALCAAPAPFDLAFIDAMIPHHQSAIAMAQVALQRATHPEVMALAQVIIDAQQREVDQMLAWRSTWYGAATPEATPDAVNHGGPIADQVSLIDALQGAGLTVEIVGPLFQPFLAPQSGTVIRLSGGALAGPAEVQVYEYVDEAAAAADAAQIGPDGNPRTAIVEWIAPPHFFRAGRLIVLYVGADPAVLDVLTALLGPQFAGQ